METNTLPILMCQMRILTTQVSSVMLRSKKLEIRKMYIFIFHTPSAHPALLSAFEIRIIPRFVTVHLCDLWGLSIMCHTGFTSHCKIYTHIVKTQRWIGLNNKQWTISNPTCTRNIHNRAKNKHRSLVIPKVDPGT
jgi:hypothetical protein